MSDLTLFDVEPYQQLVPIDVEWGLWHDRRCFCGHWAFCPTLVWLDPRPEPLAEQVGPFEGLGFDVGEDRPGRHPGRAELVEGG